MFTSIRPMRKKNIQATTKPATAAATRQTGAKLRRCVSVFVVSRLRHDEQTTRSSCSVMHSRQ